MFCRPFPSFQNRRFDACRLAAMALSCLIFCFNFLLNFSKAAAQRQADLYTIEHFSIQDGLSNRDLSGCALDQRGFLWLGSRLGLSRFDGIEFKNFGLRELEVDNHDGGYFDFKIDRAGKIWVFSRPAHRFQKIFDPATEQVWDFDEYFAGARAPFRGSEIGACYADATEPFVFYITLSTNRVFRYDGAFREIAVPPGCLVRHDAFHFSGATDPAGRLLWHSRRTLFETDSAGRVLGTFPIGQASCQSFPAAGGGHFLLGGFFPLYAADPPDQLIFVKKQGQPPAPLPLFLDGKIFSCRDVFNACVQPDGSGWGVSRQFIFRFDERQQIFQKIDLAAAMPDGQVPFINHILEQDGGSILWAATRDGLFKIHFSPKKFEKYLPAHSVRGMLRCGDSLLINTYQGQQIYRFSTRTIAPGSWRTPHGLGMAKVSARQIFIGLENDALAASTAAASPAIRRIPFENERPSEAMNLPFFDAATGTIWLGSSAGLFRFDRAAGRFVRFRTDDARLQNAYVRHFFKNEEGLWVSTDAGLFLLDGDGRTVLHLGKKSGLPDDHVRWLHSDSAGVFWLATFGGGLVRWARPDRTALPQIGDFQIFDQKTGCSNNNIYSVLEDRFGCLWLPSDYGLMRFDKSSQRVQVFMPRDGLAHEEFNFLAQFQAVEGRVFLGGLNGITVFDPADFINFQQKNKPLYLVGWSVLDGGTEKVEDRTIAVLTKNEILLDADDRFFEAKFALLDFTDPSENRYAYLIEGFEKDWNLLETNTLRFSGLPPGKYRLRVRAQGSDGQWSPSELGLPLVVRAPFWQRWQFWAVSTLAATLFFIFFNRWRTRQLLLDREKLEREIEARTDTIRRQTEELQSLNRAKNRFFENITHEFRTPLTLILAPVRELLRRRETTFENPKLELAESNAERLLLLVNQLLDLAKLESDRHELHFRQGNLLPVLHEVFAQFELAAQRKNVRLVWDCALLDLLGIADRNVLERVASNLLSNALKFTPAGGEVRLRVEKSTAAAELLLTVEDTGIGIAEGDLPHVFDRFFQADDAATRRHEGTGIGLALVKELVERMGGSIVVRSRAGAGTSFAVRLPLVLPAGFALEKTSLNVAATAEHFPTFSEKFERENLAEPPALAAATNAGFDDEFFGEMPSVLLVEDNLEMREYLNLALTAGGFAVVEAADGAAGIALARKMVPDLVVSDVMMPEKDGFELTEVLKNDLLTSHVPILLLTARGQAESRIEGYRRGADAYLPKPFDTEELLVRLRQLLAVRRRLQAKFQSAAAVAKTVVVPDGAEVGLSAFDLEFLEKLNHHILENLSDEDLLAEGLATEFFMSRSQFFAKVKALTGLPPASLIRQLRLDAAHALFLENPNLKISDVAQRVGFGDARNFSQAFRKRFGKLPHELDR